MVRSRFDQFVLLLQVGLANSSKTSVESVKAMSDVFNPNIITMINQGEDETVEKKVIDYLNWLSGWSSKPFWFRTDS